MPEEEHGNTIRAPLQSGGKRVESIEILRKPMDGQKILPKYLDYLATIDISYTVPWHHRHRYESTITLVCHDDDREAGPIIARRDSESTTKILTSLRQEQGRQNYSIPKNERMWQRPFDEEFRPELE